MKLLLCNRCYSVFSLTYHLKSCDCGLTKGRYLIDGLHTIVNGEGVSLAMDTNEIHDIAKGVPTRKDLICYARPHLGSVNPNTTIVSDIENYKEIRNIAKCRKCGDVIESKSRHDFQQCSCGAIFVDGGLDYCRRGGNPKDFEEVE